MDCVQTSLGLKYSFCNASICFLFKASEFKEKKEKALRQIDELAALDRSVEVKDRKEACA